MNKIRKFKKMVSAKTNASALLVIMLLVAGFSAMFVIVTSPSAEGFLAYTSFSYHKRVTINASKIAEDLSNFPVWLNVTDAELKDTSNGGNIQPDGDDISFFSSDNSTRYSHEIELYDGVSGTLGCWINVTQVSSSSNTICYMYYGNAGASNQQNSSGVWDSNYVLVLHMNGTGGDGSTVWDSSRYTNHGTKGSVQSGWSNQTSGKVGHCQDFNLMEHKQYINTTSDSSLDFGGDTDAVWTVEAWYKFETEIEDAESAPKLFAKDDAGGDKRRGWYYHIYDNDDGGADDMVFYVSQNADGTTSDAEIDLTGNNLDDNNWHYMMGVTSYDSAGTDYHYYYENGNIEKQGELSNTNSLSSESNDLYLWVGCHEQGNGWEGQLDEIRVSNIARNGSYQGAVYNNTNDPASFLYLGAEVEGDASSFQINGLHNSRITWSRLQDGSTWCNATGEHHETMEINMSVASGDNVTDIRVWIGDLNDTGANIGANNIGVQFSSDNTSWGANVRSFTAGGSNISVNDTLWTTANGCYGTDPFAGEGITDKTTSVFCRFRITYPAGQKADDYYSATSTTCKVYIGYY